MLLENQLYSFFFKKQITSLFLSQSILYSILPVYNIETDD